MIPGLKVVMSSYHVPNKKRKKRKAVLHVALHVCQWLQGQVRIRANGPEKAPY